MSRESLKRYTDYRILGGDTFVEKGTWTIRALHRHCQYIKDKAWSYHASCTAAISADSDSNAVLDSNIKARGKQNFHVVDASVFPRIPGVFIQAPIFMISEKAVGVILNGWEIGSFLSLLCCQ
jgi:choline dehydrogenase